MSPRSNEQNEQARAEAQAQLSRAALDVFSEFGYRAATMRDIAARAGLSYGLAYHYFPSKAAIFTHLTDFALRSTLEGLQAALAAPGKAWERLTLFAQGFAATAFTGESSAYFLIMLQAMTQAGSVPGLAESIRTRTDAYFEVLEPVIREAQADGDARPGDPRTLAAAFLAYLQGLSLFELHGKEFAGKTDPALVLSVLGEGKGRRD